MDIAETTDWKDVVKEESVPNNKNGVDKQGTKQAEEIDEEVYPLHYMMIQHEDPFFNDDLFPYVYVTCVDLISSCLVTN